MPIRVEKGWLPDEDLFDEGFDVRIQRKYSLRKVTYSEENECNDEYLCQNCLVFEHQHVFNRNLLKNSFDSQNDPQHDCRLGCSVRLETTCPELKHWDITEAGGCGWKVASTVDGPKEASGVCFVTSFSRCAKGQIVSLRESGLSSEVMDRVRPPLEVAEWCAALADHCSVYELEV